MSSNDIWIDNQMYCVNDTINDFIEKLQIENKELRNILHKKCHNYPNNLSLCVDTCKSFDICQPDLDYKDWEEGMDGILFDKNTEARR